MSVQGFVPEIASLTEARTVHLVAACLAETVKGVSTSSGFKSGEWTSIMTNFNAAAGVNYSRDQIQSQYNTLKKHFTWIEHLRSLSGVGWNECTKTIHATNEWWESHLAVKSNSLSRKFRNGGLANWDDLSVIFTGKFATGRFASSSADFIDDESKHEDSDDGSLSPTQFLGIVNGDPVDQDGLGDLDVVGLAVCAPPNSAGKGKKRSGRNSPLEDKIAKKPKKNAEIIAELKRINDNLSRPLKLTQAIILFDKEFGQHLSVIDKVKFKKSLGDIGMADLFLSFSIAEQQEFISSVLE